MNKKQKNDSVQFCPSCNCTDIKTDFSNPASVGLGIFNNAYVCNRCGHSGSFFPAVEKEKLPELKAIPEKTQRINKKLMDSVIGYYFIETVLVAAITIVTFLLTRMH